MQLGSSGTGRASRRPLRPRQPKPGAAMRGLKCVFYSATKGMAMTPNRSPVRASTKSAPNV